MRKNEGVTLLELMIGVALAATLATLAAPSFNQLIARTRLNTQTTELLSALLYTRTEALKRNTNVSMCHTADPAAAAPTCNPAANGWASGWIVFTDTGVAGRLDGTDTVLRVGQPANPMTIAVPPGGRYNNWLGFSATGLPRAAGISVGTVGAGNGTIILCNGELRRVITISTTGRITRSDNAPNNAICGAPLS